MVWLISILQKLLFIEVQKEIILYLIANINNQQLYTHSSLETEPAKFVVLHIEVESSVVASEI